jgi:hypothetical protein
METDRANELARIQLVDCVRHAYVLDKVHGCVSGVRSASAFAGDVRRGVWWCSANRRERPRLRAWNLLAGSRVTAARRLWLGTDALLCRRASPLAGRMRLGLGGWSWRCGSALAVPRCKSWSSLRPVLKHGPRSLAYTRVIGWKTHRRNESEGLFLRLICDPLHYGVCGAA